MPFWTGIAGAGQTQYFTDENGDLYMPRGDTIWSLPFNAGINGGATTWQSDIDLYMSTRASQGFNATIVSCSPSTDIFIALSGATWDGVLPWTGGVIGDMNSTWWQRVDYCVTSAEANGITVVLSPTNRWALANSGGMLNGITGAQATTYGTNLATRYASAPNIVWLMGNDFDDTAGFNTILDNVVAALRSGGANQMVTIENLTEGDSRYLFSTNTVQDWGTANSDFNWVYSYVGSYNGVNYAYQETSPLPVMYADGYYEGDIATAQPVRELERNLLWWALSSGSRGYIYGRQNLFGWTAGQSAGLTTGTFDNGDFKKICDTFGDLTGWHQLIPDYGNALVTAGRGTKLPVIGSQTGSEYTGLSGGAGGAGVNTYVTASVSPDGTLGLVYIPNAASAITVSATPLALGYAPKWIDPVSGAITPATIASTYSHPVANSVGGADWVLAFIAPGYAAWAVP